MMNQMSITLLCATMFAASACSGSKVDVSKFEVQGIKLGMSESEVVAKLKQSCLKDNTPIWTKNEEKDNYGVYFRTVFTCPKESTLGYLSIVLNDNTVNSIVSSRIILEDQGAVAHKTLVSLADKVKEKYGKPIFESINEAGATRYFRTGEINTEMNEKFPNYKHDKARIVECWADCIETETDDILYDKSTITMKTDTAGFVITFQTPEWFGLERSGVEVVQYLIDFPAQREAFNIYKVKLKAAQEAQEAAEEAKKEAKLMSEQEAVKKVDL